MSQCFPVMSACHFRCFTVVWTVKNTCLLYSKRLALQKLLSAAASNRLKPIYNNCVFCRALLSMLAIHAYSCATICSAENKNLPFGWTDVLKHVWRRMHFFLCFQKLSGIDSPSFCLSHLFVFPYLRLIACLILFFRFLCSPCHQNGGYCPSQRDTGIRSYCVHQLLTQGHLSCVKIYCIFLCCSFSVQVHFLLKVTEQ